MLWAAVTALVCSELGARGASGWIAESNLNGISRVTLQTAVTWPGGNKAFRFIAPYCHTSCPLALSRV